MSIYPPTMFLHLFAKLKVVWNYHCYYYLSQNGRCVIHIPNGDIVESRKYRGNKQLLYQRVFASRWEICKIKSCRKTNGNNTGDSTNRNDTIIMLIPDISVASACCVSQCKRNRVAFALKTGLLGRDCYVKVERLRQEENKSSRAVHCSNRIKREGGFWGRCNFRGPKTAA